MIFSTKINETIKANEKFNEKMAIRLLKKSAKRGDRSKPTDPKTIAKFVILNCSQRTFLYGARVFFVTQRKLKNSFKVKILILFFFSPSIISFNNLGNCSYALVRNKN